MFFEKSFHYANPRLMKAVTLTSPEERRSGRGLGAMIIEKLQRLLIIELGLTLTGSAFHVVPPMVSFFMRIVG